MPGRRWPASATKDTRVFRTHGFALFFLAYFYSLPLFPSAILPPNGSALSHPIFLFSSVLSRIREISRISYHSSGNLRGILRSVDFLFKTIVNLAFFSFIFYKEMRIQHAKIINFEIFNNLIFHSDYDLWIYGIICFSYRRKIVEIFM